MQDGDCEFQKAGQRKLEMIDHLEILKSLREAGLVPEVVI